MNLERLVDGKQMMQHGNKVSLPPISNILMNKANTPPPVATVSSIPPLHTTAMAAASAVPVHGPSVSYANYGYTTDPYQHNYKYYEYHRQLPPQSASSQPSVSYIQTANVPLLLPPISLVRQPYKSASILTLSSNGSPDIKSLRRKTRNNLPRETTYILLKWLNEHLNHPYPNSFEKNQLMVSTGLNQQQLSNWFINARRRKVKVLKEQKKLSG
ncbi:uncharacterized protein PRCAT00003336001 [Priceomyces carsonii]|uniref:uncharacterized protein n=1 Tax=Priceomyces carsonii TaxID=28549 RepID=UPI002ED9CB72|nr:unnamed protein product [Priceomyces carsonii]